MARMGIYVIRDLLAQESGPVFEAKNDDVAARAARMMLAQVSPDALNEHKLMRIGFVDHEKEELVAELSPIGIQFALKFENELELRKASGR